MVVVGIGYVGSAVLMEFSKFYSTAGYDRDASVIEGYREIAGKNTELSQYEEILKKASFYIITVGTPVDDLKQPDLRELTSATRTVGRHLKPGDYVVYESTVYPGCTESVCIPLLENISGLKVGKEFKVGYSPERINPGDDSHTFANTEKIVSANDTEALEEIHKVYSEAVKARICRASSIRVAEASKITENVQRAVNIALMNELHKLFSRMDIDMSEVRKLASTKWNFVDCQAGLVGGHCIPVDPYYLISEASQFGERLPVTESACDINEGMAAYIADTICRLSPKHVDSSKIRVLVMGITYKPDTDDIRNSQVARLCRLLTEKSMEVHVTDPYANPVKVKNVFGIELHTEPQAPYDVIVLAVGHKSYKVYDDRFFRTLSRSKESLFVDIGNHYRGKIKSIVYQGI